jgi:hypothetical protein
MSKAFVKESDAEEDRREEPSLLPVGLKNYMTPQGHRQLQEELRRLLRVERPKVLDVVSWAAGNGDRSENGDYMAAIVTIQWLPEVMLQQASHIGASQSTTLYRRWS